MRNMKGSKHVQHPISLFPNHHKFLQKKIRKTTKKHSNQKNKLFMEEITKKLISQLEKHWDSKLNTQKRTV